ncbi:AraC family transcriptional regulator [Antarcticibacterium sp. 1MA-6-2]|uniref:helix-turn-helix domain-containing protein n=1 Tax=Antarcticibacterium sp. 1MA-6-2 TaxID=2908210 RepID=UPI001F1DD47D|nr:AraC family transcriptional regulator [Antarcticibacterium sp. 1MA-6-2]UJH91448.1 AraC family transcriptional regulator [Antarcticibacterium sp. 1MA-6-2]
MFILVRYFSKKMLCVDLNPHPDLLEFIESLKIVHVNFATEKHLSHLYTYVPNYSQFLCIHLADRIRIKNINTKYEICPGILLIGPQLLTSKLDLGRLYKCVVVAFKPSGLYRMTNIPHCKIINKWLNARDILGTEIETLFARIVEAKGDEEINTIIQKYLLLKLINLQPSKPFDIAILQLIRASGNVSIEDVASQSCVSIRQLERIALSRIGVSPKHYSKLVRFSQAYKYKEAHPSTPWVNIAYRFGYYDHMHFIHDFKSFVGCTPGYIEEEEFKMSIKLQRLME